MAAQRLQASEPTYEHAQSMATYVEADAMQSCGPLFHKDPP